MRPTAHPEPPSNWEEALRAARAGSRAALGQLLESCRQYLLLVANDELRGDLQAKLSPSDLVQETFVEAQQGFECFRGGTAAELRGWLRRILLHNLANCHRHYATTEKRQLNREVSLDAAPSSQPGFDLPADTRSPSSHAIANEQAAALAQALARLPEHYRAVIVWRHQEGRSFAEIGERTGRTAEAARKLWARAVLELKKELGPPP
jgi:RNA polymerase sigma-70 factor (ECF subfamily)